MYIFSEEEFTNIWVKMTSKIDHIDLELLFNDYKYMAWFFNHQSFGNQHIADHVPARGGFANAHTPIRYLNSRDVCQLQFSCPST